MAQRSVIVPNERIDCIDTRPSSQKRSPKRSKLSASIGSANGNAETQSTNVCGILPDSGTVYVKVKSELDDGLLHHNSTVDYQKISAVAHNGTLDSVTKRYDYYNEGILTEQTKPLDLSGVIYGDTIKQNNNHQQLLYDNPVAGTSAGNVSPDLFDKSPNEDIGEQSNSTLNSTDDTVIIIDSDTSVECEVSPDLGFSLVTPQKSSKTQRKLPRKVNTGTPDTKLNDSINSESGKSKRKISKTGAKENVPLILYTIDQYDKYLRASGAFNGILEENSLDLLSKWTKLTDKPKTVVCHLYCVTYYEQIKGIIDDIQQTDIEEIEKLSEAGFINLYSTDLGFDECVRRLSDLNKIYKKYKTISKSNDKEMVTSLIKNYMEIGIITEVPKNSHTVYYTRLEVLKDLNEKILKKKTWQLTDLARETINELLVLIHLSNIFNMGLSVHETDKKNGRPALSFKAPTKLKCYPVDTEMLVDNASIVFGDRKEFCSYLEAHLISQKFKSTSTTNKSTIVLEAYKLYCEFTEQSMTRCSALPLWLREFTALYIYVRILDAGVVYVKKSKKYDEAQIILNELISQATFNQHRKADWYDMKYQIYLKKRQLQKAAETLKQAFQADLPEDTVYTLRRRAAEMIKNKIDPKLIESLKVYAKKVVLENSIPSQDFIEAPIPKQKSRERPKYMLGNDVVSGEKYCCNMYKKVEHGITFVEKLEGKAMSNIFFLLFWDIIYTKPVGLGGIFISHYQPYPLDMMCESFYINRKSLIENFLLRLEQRDIDEIVETMRKLWVDLYSRERKYDINIYWKIEFDKIAIVVRCLGRRALAAICRRLARNYHYTQYGFPDLTLCYEDSIKFREVKTPTDTAHDNQIQWLQYLLKHEIAAGICYLRNPKIPEPSDRQGETEDTANT